MIRSIVAGGREFNDKVLLFDVLDKAYGGVLDKLVIISGHARGADQLGEEWAKARGVPLITRPADWDTHGRAAGPIRNVEMITKDGATHAVVFWNGISTGSKHMIDSAIAYSLWVKVVRYDKRKAA